ncbi:MAG: 4Fe-4S dicluster domain-containing protein [Patescibacteria group bacterium]
MCLTKCQGFVRAGFPADRLYGTLLIMKLAYYTASREKILDMLARALPRFSVWAPVPDKEFFSFERMRTKNDLTKAAFEYDTTMLPPKKIFFPQEEVMLTQKNGKIKEPDIEKKPVLLFGVHLVDIYGIVQLDEIMEKPVQDFYYARRRKSAVLVGISAPLQPFDFAARWGIAATHKPAGFDLFLEKQGDGLPYLVIVGSQKGAQLIKPLKLLKATKAEVTIAQAHAKKMAEESTKPAYDQDLIKKAVEHSRGGPIWEELGKVCIGCGICTYVCPLCSCSDVEDTTNDAQAGGGCSRCRKWDACTLPKFAEISGGKNFRPELKDRYFNWYFHKFVRGLDEYGKAQCVGCGRCSKFCPAGINVEHVLDKIVEEYQKSEGAKTKK